MDYLPSIIVSPAHQRLHLESQRRAPGSKTLSLSGSHLSDHPTDFWCNLCSVNLTEVLTLIWRAANLSTLAINSSRGFESLTTKEFSDTFSRLVREHLDSSNRSPFKNTLNNAHTLEILHQATYHLRTHQTNIAIRPYHPQIEISDDSQLEISFLAIQCLIETVHDLTIPQQALPLPYVVEEPSLFWIENSLVDKLLRDAGWEKTEVDSLPKDIRFRYYLSFIRQEDSRRRQSRRRQRRDSTSTLRKGPSPKQQYYASHSSPSCVCPLLRADLDEWERKHAYPQFNLVNVAGPEDGCYALKLQEARLSKEGSVNIPYVAISHVRSDGLGSTLANSLPTCQVKYLQDLCNLLLPEHEKPVPFYIDTLCLPLKGPAKRSALRNMLYVFRNARKVLALDSGISGIEVSPLPQENLTRIRYSSFMQRLFTVAECALSLNVVFNFHQNVFIALNDLYLALDKDGEYPLLSNISYKFRRRNTVSSESFNDLSLALAWLSDDFHVFKVYLKKHKAGLIAESTRTEFQPDSPIDWQTAKSGLQDGALRSLLRLGFLALPSMRFFAEAAEAALLDETANGILLVYGDTVKSAKQEAERCQLSPLPCSLPELSTIDQVRNRLTKLQALATTIKLES